MNPARNWLVVREVISSTENGASVMSALPDLVRQLVDEEAWRDFTAPNPIGLVHHDTFREFIRDHPPRGLDSRVDQMLALCGSDRELIARVRGLVYGDIPAAEESIHAGPGRGNKTLEPPKGFIANSAEYLVARLKRDDPVLAEKVVSGEMSPYRAQQEKGWRPPRIYVTSAERTAASLRKHMKPDARRALGRLLLDDEEVNDGRESQA